MFCIYRHVKTKGGRWSPFTLPASLCRWQFTLYDMKDAERTIAASNNNDMNMEMVFSYTNSKKATHISDQ
ncbi:hypothetical protein OUZ56_024996 [Daphnia magna]|uniref:Uncharacterized protein n=1 Tax=Daphnia magna TaxID=35525 RepID=A0ABQ9ZJM1_9CRUS|nr:hypothetical protein OUZ56_024996 [Daphnia magna]